MQASDLKSMWEQQDAVNAAVNSSSGAHTRYNAPHEQPRNYSPPGRLFPQDVLPDKMLMEIRTMLFDYADAQNIIDFIEDVREFTAEYKAEVADAVHRLLQARDGHDDWLVGIPAKRRRLEEYAKATNLADGGRPLTVMESVFQLVPGVSSSWCSGVRQAVWRHGYWHIARSQVRVLVCSDARVNEKIMFERL